ncbi:MAG TPA: DsbA family protein [Candidatus Polarisedimenticolia bacterium]|nr:DsbA family protein [Candidatus Polarisedimenticolia bacterium]
MTTGARTVELFFDFSSPYSYLASTRIEQICERHAATLLWKPILLGPIFKEIGKVPLLNRPAEGEHARLDLARWAAWLGVPLNFPPTFPVNGLAACRGFPFAHEAGKGGAYCRRLLEACWGEGRDIGERAVLDEVAAELGLDTAAYGASLSTPEIKEWLRQETDSAAKRGVFGAPTFFVDGQEMFHGNDRLFMVEQALAGLDSLSHPPSERPLTPFGRWFGLRCLERGSGASVYELVVTTDLLNRRGTAHGGVVTSLLDTALGAAVVSGISAEEWCATLDLSVQFLEPVRPGRIVGKGQMVKRGRFAAFARGEVLDADGKSLAVGQGTWYIWPRRPSR